LRVAGQRDGRQQKRQKNTRLGRFSDFHRLPHKQYDARD
jgi:hypothetical protein